MTHSHTLLSWSLATLLASAAPTTLAGPGHDHGDAPVTTAGPALPRFAATSELFELVGIVDGPHLTLYLDHFADNRPVEDARLELELNGQAITVLPHAPGEFEAQLQSPLQAGVIAVTATVTAGKDIDLLAGELDLHDDASAHDTPPAQPGSWTSKAGWMGAGALLASLLGWALSRRRTPARIQQGDAV